MLSVPAHITDHFGDRPTSLEKRIFKQMYMSIIIDLFLREWGGLTLCYDFVESASLYNLDD